MLFTNSIPVVVTNHADTGGLVNGVTVEMHDEPVVAHWQRSTFNCLAQVIVQSEKRPGEIKLYASAEGLLPATLIISSQAAVHRPAVP